MTDVHEMLRTEASDLLGEVVDLRRRLHRHPELGLNLPETQRAVLDAVGGLGMDVDAGGDPTSVVATLRGGAPGPTVLLRADMDALPLSEESGVAFASDVDGSMHACGHDAHVAMLVGAARLLSARRDALTGTVRFMFQPGEEGHFGARHMIEDGVLDEPPVDGAFAIHIAPNLPAGWVGTRGGPLLASADAIGVTITGKGGHASTPHFAIDPIPVASEIVLALQTFVSRRIDAFDPAVLTFGRIQGGTARNVIPETVQLDGTLRAASARTRDRAKEGIVRVAEGVGAAHEVGVEVTIEDGYPATVNDTDFAALVSEVAGDLVERVVEMPSPTMGAEDFSYVLERVPGAMAFLGVCPTDIGDARSAPSCHSNRMRLDEDAMVNGIALHAAVALAFLDGGVGHRSEGVCC